MSEPDNTNPWDLLGGETVPNPPLGLGPSGSSPGGDSLAPLLKSGAVVGGRFRVDRLLGKGGMGEVYLAEDLRLERKVALKLLSPHLARDPQYLQRFRREARAASSLSHPHICVILEFGEAEDGAPYIAMEYLEGRSLETRLREGALTILEIVEIALQVADALDAAHAKGIIHRDIKIANVCLDLRGRAKVLDFGLAKQLPGAGGSGLLGGSLLGSTQSGAILGTPACMSPEQALGRSVDHRSDIFSFGVLIYQLVTGRLPFAGANVAEVIASVLNAQPPAMARFNYELPAELDRVVRKCLEKSPDRRYQSARDLLVDLQGLRRELERAAEGREPASDLAREEWPPAASLAAGPLAGAPFPVDAPRDEAELPKSDVILTYSAADDQPLGAGRQGWITQLERNLKVRLEQLTGESARIWSQPSPLGRGAVSEAVLRGLPDVKTLVSVLSPPFVRSDGCREQVTAFWRAAERSGLLEVENRPRLLKVVKTPVEEEEVPPDVAPLFSRLRSFEFFEQDPETGRLREFDETLGDLARQRFHERVYDVAHEIRLVLKYLRRRASDRSAPAAAGEARRVIYLAATTADLAPQRDQLSRELVELGFEVLPRSALPIVAGEIESAVRSALAECDFAVHLVGDRYGFVPEDTELSVVAIQNRIAAERSAAAGLERIIWMPRGLKPRDGRQEAFIRDLARDDEAHRGADVVADTFENLKDLLLARWKRKPAEDAQPAAGGESPPRVYLICDPRGQAAVEALEDFFFDRGIEVSLPGFEVDEAEAEKIHQQNLRDCDAALIYYGAAGSHWIDFQIRQLQKAAGYRDGRPIALRAVFVAPPASHRKDRFRSVSVDCIRQAGEAVGEAELEAFAKKIAECGMRNAE